jgi:tetratricopeptide (TPR) repeat protein|tara:strand:- start:82 stop:597 length:516 start_codon:yes stop_codon:yes gene_type:complete
MISKYLNFIFIIFLFNSSVCSAGTTSTSSSAKSDGREDLSYMSVKNTNYKKGYDALKQAIKYDKKGKTNKANKRFNDSIKFFIKANKENHSKPDILIYLGFAYEKVNDFTMAEIYYTQGLEIDPQHIGINEYLGKFYIRTNRINKAKERLTALENCNCKEFEELKFLIQKK